MHAAALDALLPRLATGPAALTRSTRRLARTFSFALDRLWGAAPVPSDGPALARRIGWIAENVCALHGVQVVVRGRPPAAPAVIVGNHLGYLDPPALASVAPAIPIAKRELSRWPVVGELVREHRVLLVDRDDPYSGARVLRSALAHLASGASVLAFPEGTTTRGDRVLPFKRGIFGVARRLGAPVAPVAVRYSPAELAWVGDTWFLPHYLGMTAHRAARVELTFGALLDPRSAASPAALAEAARESIVAALAS